MAKVFYMLTFAVTFVRALGCSEEGCIVKAWDESEDNDIGLSLLQTGARMMHDDARLTGSEKEAPEEVAYVDFIRHAEKCGTGSFAPIITQGFERIAYLKRCMSSSAPSAALPFGPPTAVMYPGSGKTLSEQVYAKVGSGGNKPMETALPIAEELNLPLHATPNDSCAAQEVALVNGNATLWSAYLQCMVDTAKQQLTNRGTLLLFGIYQRLPVIVGMMGIPNLADQYNQWPYSCSTTKLAEAECTFQAFDTWFGWNQTRWPYLNVSVCFGAIWQVKLTRPSGSNSWQAWQSQSIKSLHEGFGGSASSPCSGDLTPQKTSGGTPKEAKMLGIRDQAGDPVSWTALLKGSASTQMPAALLTVLVSLASLRM